MRVSRIYKVGVVAAVALVSLGFAMVGAGVAWGAPGHRVHTDKRNSGFSPGSLRSLIVFDSAKSQVEFTIPTPSCPEGDSGCVWALYVNEPKLPGQPEAGLVTGSSGVLVVPYPAICGTIQADVFIGGPPWTYKSGSRTSILDCPPPTTTTTTTTVPTTTTTTTKPSTTTTTKPTPSSTSTSTTLAPNVAATTSTVGGKSSSLPFTSATAASASGTSTDPSSAAASSQLPFTGLDPKPLLVVGSLLVLLGLMLLSTVESRRRMLKRATALRVEHLKDQARKSSSWFLGL